MPNYGRSLADWCECMKGKLPKGADWVSLLGLANQTLTTPALKDFAAHFKGHIPDDVYRYIMEMFERNVVRNRRLLAQLNEAVAAINARGVTPVLMKGAAMLATTPQAAHGLKLMSDLDMIVAPSEVEATLQAVQSLGYAVYQQTGPEAAGTWHIDLQRSRDVGMIDLHRTPPGPAFFYSHAGDVLQHCKLVRLDGGAVYIPSNTFQALILTIHDHFQDCDYWSGDIDLRHLLELRDLALSPEGIDWDQLASFVPDKLARNALETQLLALALLDVEVPAHMRSRLIPRLQHWRRLTQAKFPLMRQLALPLTALDYLNYREGLGRANGAGKAATGHNKWTLPKANTLSWLLWLAGGGRAGKV